MGYRLNLGKGPKQESDNTYRHLTKEDFFDEEGDYKDDHSAPYYPKWHTQLYCLGKYVNAPADSEPYYHNEDLRKYIEESEFLIIGKEALKELIDRYRKDIAEHYKGIAEGTNEYINELNDIHGTTLEKYFKNECKNKAEIWGDEVSWRRPFYLDEPEEKRDGMMTPQWDKEHAIYNLLFIYHTFDWENDYLIFSGW